MNKIINNYFTYINAPTLQNFTWGGVIIPIQKPYSIKNL